MHTGEGARCEATEDVMANVFDGEVFSFPFINMVNIMFGVGGFGGR